MIDVAVLYEHPQWQLPLFEALDRRGVRYEAVDVKRATFGLEELPRARLYFNQASPSAYVRGHARAVPFAMALMRTLELSGARVLNGSTAFALELSKTAQAALLRKLGLDRPDYVAFNDVEAVRTKWSRWPALLKPEQGGSGARMFLLRSFDELEQTLRLRPDLWHPDGLLLLQEYFPIDSARGIVRMEFVGGELLYAMRVVAHGGFNLCPSEVCHPASGPGACVVPSSVPPVEFHPYRDVPSEAVEAGLLIMSAGGLDVGGIEYLEAAGGRRIFFDINANSNLRLAVGLEHGFDPFDRVAAYLEREASAGGAARSVGLGPHFDGV